MFRNKRNGHDGHDPSEFAEPLDELTHLLDKLEALIENTMDEYVESILPPPAEPQTKRASVLDSLKKFRSKRLSEGEESSTPPPSSEFKEKDATVVPETPESSSSAVPSTPLSKTPSKRGSLLRSSSFFLGSKGIDAKFITMGNEKVDQTVEVVRRIAELVVFGERLAGSAERQKQKLDKIAEKQKAGDELMEEEEEAINKQGQDNETEKYTAIFEHFFERNGLELITKLLTGKCFDLTTHEVKPRVIPDSEKIGESSDQEVVEIREIDLLEHNYMLLPPLPIAIQAFQSVSILVQNVSRATSLFFILSNNYVNQLINFPLEQYHVAERRKLNQETSMMSPRRFGSPELAEMTTHFVTFLKSLALRVNIETLQFFLTYPPDAPVEEIEDESSPDEPDHFADNNPQDMDDDGDRPLDEIASNSAVKPTKRVSTPVKVKTVTAEFPLYERALEFCSAHHDSFVRVTAMNICMNILRLPTVRPAGDAVDGDGADFATGSSPDGVLHNAKALPMKERLAIAQFVCYPPRVERLASPIFTKLAQIWGVIEEQFRAMDSPLDNAPDIQDADDTKGKRNSSNEKVMRAKEKARRQKSSHSFDDMAFNLQDELLLLEDILKVGLTSLNEQMIEMMFATFVYPLLLQPLLLYFQRNPVPDELLFADPLNDHSAGREIEVSDLTARDSLCGEKSLISAPTKSAFFSLAAVFQFVTNQPLLRLLFTAVLHPLSPGSTGETTIRASADVACKSSDGKLDIRIDPIDENGKVVLPTDRSTYSFGKATGQKYRSNYPGVADDDSTCVFVLAPALAEILEFKGDDGALIARTRHNPYRTAIFKCFALSSQLSDLKNVSALAVDSMVSPFDEKFLAEILFGLDLKKYEDNLPNDEKTSGSRFDFDDRDIGDGVKVESRVALGGPTGGKLVADPMNEVLSSFRTCIMTVVPGGSGEKILREFGICGLKLFSNILFLSPLGTWKLEYDSIAAHALLCIVRGNEKSMADVAKGIDSRCRQAAAFLSDMHLTVQKVGGEKIEALVNGNSDDEVKTEIEKHGIIMDMIFRGYGVLGKSPSLLNDFLELKLEHRVYNKPGHIISISSLGSYTALCSRSCSFPPLDSGGEAILINSMSSARAWAKLGKFKVAIA